MLKRKAFSILLETTKHHVWGHKKQISYESSGAQRDLKLFRIS